jgi:hypothetical protein
MLIDIISNCFPHQHSFDAPRLCVKNRLKGTDWGELDVLILDLPPGTRCVQLRSVKIYN